MMADVRDQLITLLDKAERTFRKDKPEGHVFAIQAVCAYLDAIQIPAKLVVPLVHLQAEILQQQMRDNKKGYNKKPLAEALAMATAAAAVTFGMKRGAYGSIEKACRPIARKLENAGFRVGNDGTAWSWGQLEDHRHSLDNCRGPDIGLIMYQYHVKKLAERKDITDQQKADMLIDNILRFV